MPHLELKIPLFRTNASGPRDLCACSVALPNNRNNVVVLDAIGTSANLLTPRK